MYHAGERRLPPIARRRRAGPDLPDADGPALHAAPGFLLFVRAGVLLAQRFDASRLRSIGGPQPIAERLGQRPTFSVSQNGVLIYRTSAIATTQFAWFDRTGKPLATMGDPAIWREFVLSRDGTQVAAERVDLDSGKRSLWQIDVSRGISTRLTDSADNDENMVWSPDARELVFTSDGKEGVGLFHKAIAGGEVTTLLKSAERQWPEDWSSDGRCVVSVSVTHRRLEIMPMFGDRQPFVFIDTPGFKDEPQFSPDVRWMAYLSEESGRYEIYVERFSPGRRQNTNLIRRAAGAAEVARRRPGAVLPGARRDPDVGRHARRHADRRAGTVFPSRIHVRALIHQWQWRPTAGDS